MIKTIKNNHIYHFLARVLAVAVFSIFTWIAIVVMYDEYTIANDIKKAINQKKDEMLPLIKNIDFLNKNDSYYKFIEEIKTTINDKGTVYIELLDKHNKRLLKIDTNQKVPQEVLDSVKEFDITSKDVSEIIPVDANHAYLYMQSTIYIGDKSYYINLLTRLDKKTIEKLKTTIEGSLFILISTILIMFISILPIVYSQYKQMLEKQNELMESNINTLVSLGSAVAKRDSDTSEHNYRVTYYSIKIAEHLNISNDEIRTIIKGSFLHDIGKIAISDNILLKPGKLTTQEFEIMKTHVNSGIDIIKNDKWLKDAQKVILNHHEKVDGSGYPNGLKDDDIPIEARIFAIADVFDALTSKRPYKEPFSLEKSIEILKQSSGSHFDSNIINSFEMIYKELNYDIANKNSDELEIIFHKILKPYFFNKG
jgi:HD-GYP domain-containing protein (c-di-GMP phosphodiesterase class II)